MAHFTKEFRRSVLLPLAILTATILSLATLLSVAVSPTALLILGPVFVAIVLCIREFAIWRYRGIRVDCGMFEYSPGSAPHDWHFRMGYLRMLEIITPIEYRLDLYRRCGAEIGDKVVLAGKILEPEITKIGSNTVIGVDAILTAHEIMLHERQTVIRLLPVVVGENCVIGARSILLPGARVPDNTMIPAGTVVKRSTVIPKDPTKGEQ